MLPKVEPHGEYTLKGSTLNALIDAANSWQNLRVELVQGASEITRLIHSPGGAILRIVVPPSTGGGGEGLPEGVVWEEFTICDSGSPATRWLPTSTTDPSA